MGERAFRALLVGNSTFPEDPNLLDLIGPVNDVNLLQTALTNPEFGLFPSDNVRLLLDKTKQEITREMEAFFRSARREDQLLFYYSGHGVLSVDNDLYLCARDTHTDMLVSSALRDEEANTMIRASRAQSFVIIVDCCHSGRWRSSGRLPTKLKGTGRFVITSSRAAQLAADADVSLFTRHLVDGLLRAPLDANDDGYVAVTDIYDYVFEQLTEENQQTPQRHFDDAVGDIALARRPLKKLTVPRITGKLSEKPPELFIPETDQSIEIRDVRPSETLPVEIIDVFNRGGGELDWTVESDAEWISVAPKTATSFEMNLHPRPGINRGKVRVRDRGRGGSAAVRVVVHLLEEEQPPKLELSASQIDFGTLSLNEEAPQQTVQLRNRGGGDLRVRAVAREGWIVVEQLGDVLAVGVDTSSVGHLGGDIIVQSEGGVATIKVRAEVAPGPILQVNARSVDFGRVPSGERREARVTVRNAGTGELTWDYDHRGDFFEVHRDRESLRIVLHGRPGRHVGSLWITSNGGQISLDVRAETPSVDTSEHLTQAGPVGRAAEEEAKRQARIRWIGFLLMVAGIIARMVAGLRPLDPDEWFVSFDLASLTLAAVLVAMLFRNAPMRLIASGAVVGFGIGTLFRYIQTLAPVVFNGVESPKIDLYYVGLLSAPLLVVGGLLTYRGTPGARARSSVLVLISATIGTALLVTAIVLGRDEFFDASRTGWPAVVPVGLAVATALVIMLIMNAPTFRVTGAGVLIALGAHALLRFYQALDRGRIGDVAWIGLAGGAVIMLAGLSAALFARSRNRTFREGPRV
jgi:hypothetical protein